MIILFRSDTRKPNDIFQNGFSRRVNSEGLYYEAPFESDVTCSIALSSTLEATPCFPYDNPATHSWIYIVAVDPDTNNFLDFHSFSLSEDTRKEMGFNLPFCEFPKEKIIDRVSAEHVLCALPIRRDVTRIDNTYYCFTFKILSEAVKNMQAEVFLKKNTHIDSQLDDILEKYHAKTWEKLKTAQPNARPCELKKSKARNAFFVMNRFDPLKEYKHNDFEQPDYPKIMNAFLASAELENTSGCLFSSTQDIGKQNSLFYAAIENGMFDKTIEENAAEIEKFRLAAREHFITKDQPSNTRLTHRFGEELPENYVKSKELVRIKRKFFFNDERERIASTILRTRPNANRRRIRPGG